MLLSVQLELSDHITIFGDIMPKAHAKSYAGFAPRQLLFFCSVLSGAAALVDGRARGGRQCPGLRAESSSGGLEEIVVTATRREESMSKVPISVTALTQDAMDQRGIKDFPDIVRFTPGVNIDTSGTNAISIRGISSSGGAGTTGIYIDDTPIQMRSLGFNPDDTLPKTFDLERVEVLRGPQGTLFGAGSEGGAVRYIMTQPSMTEASTPTCAARSSYTEYGQPSGEVGIAHGGPIIDGMLGNARQHLVPLRRRLDRPRGRHDRRRSSSTTSTTPTPWPAASRGSGSRRPTST